MTVNKALLTQRLTLRPYQLADQADFVALNTDPVARKHMDGPLTAAQARQRFSHCLAGERVRAWAVTRSDDEAYLGHVFLQEQSAVETELGFILRPAVWNHGYGAELARAVVAFALTRYPRVIATVDSDNPASIRVLEKSGLFRETAEQDAQGVYFVYSGGAG